jgi:MoxR-like ATPase
MNPTTNAKSQNFDHLIPKVPNGYIVTKMATERANIVNQLLHDQKPFILQGEAGAGKDLSIMAVCATNKWPLFIVSCSGDMKTSHILGRMVPDPDHPGSFMWQDGPMALAVRHGLTLNLNEINSVNPDIMFALHMVLEYKVLVVAATSEVIPAHPNFRICGTMNPSTYYATKPINQAFLDRFRVLDVHYDPDVDATLIRKLGLDKDEEVAFANLIAKIRDAVQEGQVSQNFGHRTLSMIVSDAKIFGFDKAFAMAYTNKLQPTEGAAIKSAIRDLVGKVNVRQH